VVRNIPLAFPFPKIGNGIFFLHSRSRKLEMEFSNCIPVPKIGNGIFISVPVSEIRELNYSLSGIPDPENCEWNFHFSSCSRKLGMEFSTLTRVPENWESNFPLAFPIPKLVNGIFHSRSRSPKVIPAHPCGFNPITK